MVKVTGREKIISICGGSLVILLLILHFLILPAGEKMQTLERRIGKAEEEIKEMEGLKEEYMHLGGKLEEMEGKLHVEEEGVSFSLLEKLARQAGLGNHLDYMKPRELPPQGKYQETVTEMKLRDITMGFLVDCLHRIENSSHPLRIKSLRIRMNRNQPGLLEAILTISTFSIP